MELTAVQVGLKNTVSEEVTEEKTARAMGSGSLPVYATPAMTCLMEKAATEAVEALVPEGWTTVGISLHVAHTAATPVGLTVRAEAEVTAVEGRKIIFTVRAYDDQGEIGVGSHERFAVAKEKFLAKAAAKVQH
ncbi:thioesterase family protein [Selenomonas ruminantium]|jgi:predicted thioesterase|uniref:Dihydrolipoamide acyltransferase n=1 Tax=Selenomonas ruminantium TaxID=971 RepID=A0A1K1QWI7_SELRU|nr:thioesterase family protein [Selenomonas ruminantium]MBE6086291.1 dihydrolipoamide acyltransferase [Selenomonas ruminantium]SFW63678.1 Predicted thioesterase [Selenomonas ruminantium]